jgi:hypothetical protein
VWCSCCPWFASCSSSDTGSGTASDCDSATKALCQKFDSCSHFLLQVTWGDLQTCAERGKLDCEAEAASPGAGMTQDQAGKCANAATALSCDQLFGGADIAACDVAGTRDDGQPCGYDSQCKSGSCKGTSGLCGVCTPRSAAGGSCNGDGDCETGLNCANQICVAPVADGGSCTSSGQCKGISSCHNGICAAPLGAGQDCNATSDCDLLHGLVCGPGTKKCAAATLAQPGETCGQVNGTLIACAGGGQCAGSAGSTSGTCAAGLADGASCSDTSGPSCLNPAECINGSCTLRTSTSCG